MANTYSSGRQILRVGRLHARSRKEAHYSQCELETVTVGLLDADVVIPCTHAHCSTMFVPFGVTVLVSKGKGRMAGSFATSWKISGRDMRRIKPYKTV